MKIIYLTSRAAGKSCGVHDYTELLANHVAELGIDVEHFTFPRWTISNALSILASARASNAIIHLQYPSLGMGNSPAPALLPLINIGSKSLITLHEFKSFNWVRKNFIRPFAAPNCKIIATTEFEAVEISKFLRRKIQDVEIIPIGNNIANLSELPIERRSRLLYFGQLIPKRGLENFFGLVQLIRSNKVLLDVAIIGSLPDPGSSFARYIIESSRRLGVDTYLDLPAAEVSKQLSSSTVAYLPFLDGVTDKRGSALACLEHGLQVITTWTAVSPKWLVDATHGACSVDRAFELAKRLTFDPTASVIQSSILQERLAERKWRSIAERHQAVYSKLLGD